MSQHYDEYYSKHNGQMVIYTLASSVYKTYQVRIRIPGTNELVRRSLKTGVRDEALYLAENLYLELRARTSQGLPLVKVDFSTAFVEYVDQRRTEKPWAENACNQYLITNDIYFSRFFNQFSEMSVITSADVRDYWEYRRNFWEPSGGFNQACRKAIKSKKQPPIRPNNVSLNPSWNTLSKEKTMLSNVFSYARDQGWIGKVPSINNPLKRDDSANRRAGFTPDEYQRLIRAINGRCRRVTRPQRRKKKTGGLYKPYRSPTNVRAWEALRAFVLTISNTGIRVQELLRIRWEQVELREDVSSGLLYTIIHVTKSQSKTGKRRSVVARNFGKTYEYLMRWKKHALFQDDDDLIFTSDERRAKNRLTKTTGGKGKPRDFQFMIKTLLRELDLHEKEEDGIIYKRSATSLRHFYCSMRLMEGCPIKPLSDNMGTSYQMIEQNYAHLIPWEMRDFLTLHRDGYGRNTVQPDEDSLDQEQ